MRSITRNLVLVGVAICVFALLTVDFSKLGEVEAEIGLKRFSSYDELKNFIKASNLRAAYGLGEPTINKASQRLGDAFSMSEAEYSATNIQVEGVDEADTVKTDGEYIYVISNNEVVIVKAYPPEEAAVLSRISVEGALKQMFVKGDRLVVFVDNGNWSAPQAMITVYSVADKAGPEFVRTVAVDGYYVDSRLIGDYVYAVVSKYVYPNQEIVLPSIRWGNVVTRIPATEIYYSELRDSSYSITVVAAVNIQDSSRKPAYETLLLGASTSTMYVSLSNIYIAMAHGEETALYRIHVEEDSVEYVAEGKVRGTVLNQFSMDEHEDHFRIATTTGWYGRNDVYVLNMDLEVVGALENLAAGERIYSARFMGDRGYLVTFKKVDPLFVIDLRYPEVPEVLGYLKVTGYSDYLHPYDENHLIGVGKETVAADGGNFAWYQGVKISLFDVTNVEEPMEIAKYEIGDRGTDSPILRDHKAFLFSRAKNLLVIPVSVAEITQSPYSNEVSSWTRGAQVWQGAYVFSVSLEEGLVLMGKITHNEDGKLDWKHEIYRSLYISNNLYTISNTKIEVNSLEDLRHIKDVVLEAGGN